MTCRDASCSDLPLADQYRAYQQRTLGRLLPFVY
jgi:hypothetical protein